MLCLLISIGFALSNLDVHCFEFVAKASDAIAMNLKLLVDVLEDLLEELELISQSEDLV